MLMERRKLEIKGNEIRYEFLRETFVVTDFTGHNLMDGPVSTGND